MRKFEALHTLVRLFEAFPRRTDLDSRSIGIDAKPTDSNETWDEIWSDIMLGYDSIDWLKEEGFISVQSVTLAGDFKGVRLTLSGLTLLGYQPPTLEAIKVLRTMQRKAQKFCKKVGVRRLSTLSKICSCEV